MRLRLASLLAVLAAAAGILALPSTASAAVGPCKTYDRLMGHGAGQACLYPAADYPGFRGKVYLGAPCGGRILPADSDDNTSGDAVCIMNPRVATWKWTGSWLRSYVSQGSYTVYPYAANWRWVYSAGAWHAVDAGEAKIRWFCPSPAGVRGCYAF